MVIEMIIFLIDFVVLVLVALDEKVINSKVGNKRKSNEIYSGLAYLY